MQLKNWQFWVLIIVIVFVLVPLLYYIFTPKKAALEAAIKERELQAQQTNTSTNAG